MIVNLLLMGLGWSELPLPVIKASMDAGDLVQLNTAFQQSDVLEGIDVVWTEQHVLGMAGQWLRDHLLNLPQDVWRGPGLR